MTRAPREGQDPSILYALYFDINIYVNGHNLDVDEIKKKYSLILLSSWVLLISITNS